MSKKITLSLVDALKSFSIWKDERAKVRVGFWVGEKAAVRGAFNGVIVAVARPEPGVVTIRGDDETSFEVDLGDCTFVRADATSVFAGVARYEGERAWSAQFTELVEARFPSGDVITFFVFSRSN